jgi:hypothetical protein
MKACPFCAEEIQDEAIVCKHCGRDPNAPQLADLAVQKRTLDEAIHKYVEYGYSLVSRLETVATMERRAAVEALKMISLVLLMWPLAVIYAFPGTRKLYRVQLGVNAEGHVEELGDTIDQVKKDEERGRKTWTIVLIIVVALLACAIVSSIARQ